MKQKIHQLPSPMHWSVSWLCTQTSSQARDLLAKCSLKNWCHCGWGPRDGRARPGLPCVQLGLGAGRGCLPLGLGEAEGARRRGLGGMSAAGCGAAEESASCRRQNAGEQAQPQPHGTLCGAGGRGGLRGSTGVQAVEGGMFQQLG